MSPPPSRIDIMLRLTAEHPDRVAIALEGEPDIASKQDVHGYSLLHAAASYGHVALMKSLVQEHQVNSNITDEDGETPLFYAENVEVVQCLIDELGADASHKNEDGSTALEKLEQEGEGDWVRNVISKLRSYNPNGEEGIDQQRSNGIAAFNGIIADRPPAIPDNLQINIGSMVDNTEEPVDPEFKRRIDELVARGNLDHPEGQEELRQLVSDAVVGLREDEERDSNQRRRLGD
jgi:ankyrin repeat protein